MKCVKIKGQKEFEISEIEKPTSKLLVKMAVSFLK